MSLRVDLVGAAELFGLVPEWRTLAAATGATDPTLAPEWTLACADALPPGSEIVVALVREGRELCALAPLVRTETRMARALPMRVLTQPGALLLGAAAPASMVLLALRGAEVRACLALFDRLLEARFDLVDLGAVDEAAPVRALIPSLSTSRGDACEVNPTPPGLYARLGGSYEDYAQALARLGRPAARRGLAELGVKLLAGSEVAEQVLWLARRQSHARGRPLLGAADAAGLSELVRRFADQGALRMVVASSAGRAQAGFVAIATGDTLTVLLRPVDPEAARAGAADALMCDQLRAAIASGIQLVRLPQGDAPCERFATGQRRVFRMRVFGRTPAGQLLRGSALWATRAAPRARAALERIRGGEPALAGARAAATDARRLAWTRLSLYRAELPASIDPRPPGNDGLQLAPMTLGEFDQLAPARRQALCAVLELQEAYCRQKWARGDRVVRADLDGEPAGILWCARAGVYVPELDREVRPGPTACYVHDVFVAPWARGRAVAPALLAWLAGELRAADIQRAWALIRRDNRASARAFEKAAFVPVCEVLYARVGAAARLVTRPADAEAHKLLGL